jgi:spiro-SPASM protein
MNALALLYGGSLRETAYENLFSGKNALSLTLERTAAFPELRKTILLLNEDAPQPPDTPKLEIIRASHWTKRQVLETLSQVSQGFDLSYYAWADCPFLDPGLAKAVMERHIRYAAEYSYADGWPYGLAPEVLAPGVAGILAKILEGKEGPEDREVGRDAIFSVLQRDINAFDIETEISPVDLRFHRLSLSADCRRNLLILTRFSEAGLFSAESTAQEVERIIGERPEILRTLPNFYPIQVARPCPQTCRLCPYPHFSAQERKNDDHAESNRDFIELAEFDALLDRIGAFSGDAVIDLSLWGELGLHPGKTDLIRAVLARQNLSLVIETSGIGWKTAELEALANERRLPRVNGMAPLSWILSLDTQDPARYRDIRGEGYTEAVESAKTLIRLFPEDAYVQAVRVKGFEDDIERFYRSWKDRGAKVIIQKYDSFCGLLPDLEAADLSPVKRRPCWHLLRDMPILINGDVLPCREEPFTGRVLGNVFSESLESIWAKGAVFYQQQCVPMEHYDGICAECNEYYTYNF